MTGSELILAGFIMEYRNVSFIVACNIVRFLDIQFLKSVVGGGR